jgi:hypothetical protein
MTVMRNVLKITSVFFIAIVLFVNKKPAILDQVNCTSMYCRLYNKGLVLENSGFFICGFLILKRNCGMIRMNFRLNLMKNFLTVYSFRRKILKNCAKVNSFHSNETEPANCFAVVLNMSIAMELVNCYAVELNRYSNVRVVSKNCSLAPGSFHLTLIELAFRI